LDQSLYIIDLGEQAISIPNNCAVVKMQMNEVRLSYLNCITALCCKHINNFKSIQLSILRYSFARTVNLHKRKLVITCAAVLYVEGTKLRG